MSSKGVLTYTGMKYDAKAQQEKPHFQKKDGGEWSLGPGPVNWGQFQAGTKLYVEWADWNAISAAKDIPAGGGGKGNWKPPPYHNEQFVSNVVGQAIAAGLIKDPSQLAQWANSAWLWIGTKGGNIAAPAPSQAPQSENPAPGGGDFDDRIPFSKVDGRYI